MNTMGELPSNRLLREGEIVSGSVIYMAVPAQGPPRSHPLTTNLMEIYLRIYIQFTVRLIGLETYSGGSLILRFSSFWLTFPLPLVDV